jgi:hypothetical protein
MTVLGSFVLRIREGATYSAGDVDRREFDLPIAFVELPKDEFEGRLNVTMAIYGDEPFDALQVVTPDEDGLFPWDEGCDPRVVARQPVLGIAPA